MPVFLASLFSIDLLPVLLSLVGAVGGLVTSIFIRRKYDSAKEPIHGHGVLKVRITKDDGKTLEYKVQDSEEIERVIGEIARESNETS